MPKKIVLLNCLSADLISGGNIYNRYLIQELRALGEFAEQIIVEPDGLWFTELNKDTYYLLDSILLRYPLAWDKLDSQQVTILLHMCPSLDSDLTKAEKTTLRKNEAKAYQRLPIISTGLNNLNYISEEMQVQSNNTVVIPPAVSKDWTRCNGLPDVPKKLLTLGSISSGKGLERTLEVLHKIKDLPWTWTHYGPIKDQGLYKTLSQFVETHNMNDRIQFYGAIDHSLINNVLLEHHLLLHLSDHENYGMAIQESIATGLPFVMTQVGDYKSLNEGGLGWISKSYSPDDIAKLLSNVLTNSQKYKAMIMQLHSVKIDTWSTVAKRTLQFIQANQC